MCHQTKDDISRCREIARLNAADPNANAGDPCSPWRDRPTEVIDLSIWSMPIVSVLLYVIPRIRRFTVHFIILSHL